MPLKPLGKTDKNITQLAGWLNGFAALMVAMMMLVTCVDVFLRYIRLSIPGSFEIVGSLGALSIAFALAGTSLGKGHIAVEYLVGKFPKTTQKVIERINAFVAALFFLVITWQAVIHALDFKENGEVSMTLQMPVYPFMIGIAIGTGILSVVMLLQAVGLVHYGD